MCLGGVGLGEPDETVGHDEPTRTALRAGFYTRPLSCLPF